MSILDFLSIPFQKKTAQVAKERLQIVVSHQRSEGTDDFLPQMRNELLEVVRKYVEIEPDQINIQLQRDGNRSVLELNVALPKELRKFAKDEALEVELEES